MTLLSLGIAHASMALLSLNRSLLREIKIKFSIKKGCRYR